MENVEHGPRRNVELVVVDDGGGRMDLERQGMAERSGGKDGDEDDEWDVSE